MFLLSALAGSRPALHGWSLHTPVQHKDKNNMTRPAESVELFSGSHSSGSLSQAMLGPGLANLAATVTG